MHLSPPAVRSKVVVLLLLTFCIVTPMVLVCNVICFVIRNFMSILVLQSIILMGKRGLVALLNLSSWCLVVVEWLILAVPQGCLRFVSVVFPDHTHLLFLRLELRDSNPETFHRIFAI